jgi:hypothetical protein
MYIIHLQSKSNIAIANTCKAHVLRFLSTNAAIEYLWAQIDIPTRTRHLSVIDDWAIADVNTCIVFHCYITLLVSYTPCEAHVLRFLSTNAAIEYLWAHIDIPTRTRHLSVIDDWAIADVNTCIVFH